MNRRESIRQLKRLLFAYHPDRCTDERLRETHLEMTQKLTAALEVLEKRPPPGDYEVYRTATDHYRNIHPDRLYRREAGGTLKAKTAEEQRKVVDLLLRSIGLAQEGYRQLIGEYPSSVWVADAQEKLTLLTKLEQRYRKFVPGETTDVMDHRKFLDHHGLRLI